MQGEIANLSGVVLRDGRALEGAERDAFVKENARRIRRKMRASFVEHARRHIAFFEGQRIDARIVCLGDYIALPKSAGYAYTLSVADMARFGVCGVTAPDDYAARVAMVLREREKSDVAGMIRLADYPAFEPRFPPDAWPVAPGPATPSAGSIGNLHRGSRRSAHRATPNSGRRY